MRSALTILMAAAPWGAAQPQPMPAPTLTPAQVRSLAATCAQCHGTEGRPADGSILPPLAGRPEAELMERLSGFKAGTMPSTIMTQLTKGYSDSQLRSLAAYFAAQAR